MDPRTPSPIISPLHSRSPFSLLPSSKSSSSSKPRPFSSSHASSSSSSSSPLPSRWCRSFLPRSKTRFLLLLLLLSTLTFLGLLSFSILNIDLPPIDSYDDKQPPLDEATQQRSFEEPSFALLSSPQPHSIGCPQRDSPTAPLLMLGVFSAPDKVERRNLIRNETKGDWPKELVEFKFIFGRPATLELARMLSKEQEEFGDIVIVGCEENIDTGKTHAYFEWVADTRVGENPQFVMKADDDTFLVMPNVIRAFQELDCSKNIYWGTTAGATYYFPTYMRGLGYALSWPLAKWIGSADISPAHTTKIEDARTSQWLRNLNPDTDPVEFIDNGWSMGDYNQLAYAPETIALHWLKFDDWFRNEKAKILKIWEEAGRKYEVGQGVEPRLSIEHGKLQPDAAAKEKQRQKDMGWDV
ncbi:hypothetical protein BDY24DRAFT_335088 [Mrakia frigida]|uniref:uncharacterized protein n=1 Tax=Mrakia frigida TaxID=29902 RepID=UPI003FCC1B05